MMQKHDTNFYVNLRLSLLALAAIAMTGGTPPAKAAEKTQPSENKTVRATGHSHTFHTGSSGHAHTDQSQPIGIMNGHSHGAGEWMLSYRYRHMNMHGSRDGTDSLSPLAIATTVPNRFFGVAGQPPTLRVVPTDMTMDMHMIGAMYAPTDKLTLSVMGMWMEKEMDHLTFQGGAGPTVLGTFTTASKGWSDTKIGALIPLYKKGAHHILLKTGVSLPTGDINKSARVLAPTGATPRLRLPYAMQLGTGTYDFHPALTYSGSSRNETWSWGAQYAGEIRLEDENSENYRWGDKHNAGFWASYRLNDQWHASARFDAMIQSTIKGVDPQIVAPVQTADPGNYGGKSVDFSLGAGFTATKGPLKGQTIGTELILPVYRNLNGPQLETDWSVIFGTKYNF